MPHCRHCGDELPDDCPTRVASCQAYGDWRARRKGDLLGAAEANDLILLAGLCAVAVALRDGPAKLPDVR
jgi:hypothetical protein